MRDVRDGSSPSLVVRDGPFSPPYLTEPFTGLLGGAPWRLGYLQPIKPRLSSRVFNASPLFSQSFHRARLSTIQFLLNPQAYALFPNKYILEC